MILLAQSGPLLAEAGSALTALLAGALGAVVGLLGGYLVMRWLARARLDEARREAERTLHDAQSEADVLRKTAAVDAKAEFVAKQEELRKEAVQIRAEQKEADKRLAKREDNLEAKLDTLATKERNLEHREAKLNERADGIRKKEDEIEAAVAQQRAELVRISGMTVEEGKRVLLDHLSDELDHERAAMVERSVTAAKDEAAQLAREITLTAIQRYAAEHTSESTVSTVDIPNDDMKGRVIGREGRNIRAFEKATGVDVIVDDTPGLVLVSAFDPVRKEIARLSLERLIQDGRIHPGRIEELVAQVRKEVDAEVIEAGKRASVEANVGGLHRKELDMMGRLRYRTSYGQNVLRHSLEVAFLCQAIADELGLDGRLARRCGFLHDIGKAIPHDAEGAHPKLGAEFCKRFNERPEVLNAIAGHHGDVPSTSPYTPIVMAADAISAARPGSRRESLERYVQRLQQLEELAKVHPGVREAYAIQAGREIRIIVDAKRVDDAGAAAISRSVAKDVEEQMTYPGEIRVTVLREVRAVAHAR
ncbi:MAG: ribonuclease Y [Phycisphaerae bacterium]